MGDEPAINTALHGLEFAPWRTPVEDDDLFLMGLKYGGSAPHEVTFPGEGFSLALDGTEGPNNYELEATFLSREKRAAVFFGFNKVSAFRVLDEGALLDLWEASEAAPRPTSSTFLVRGHKWQDESFLAWGLEGQYSYMVATDGECLEIVTVGQPVVEFRPAIVSEFPPYRVFRGDMGR